MVVIKSMLCYVMSWRSLLTSTLDVSNFRYKSTSRTHVGVSENTRKEKQKQTSRRMPCHISPQWRHRHDSLRFLLFNLLLVHSFQTLNSFTPRFNRRDWKCGPDLGSKGCCKIRWFHHHGKETSSVVFLLLIVLFFRTEISNWRFQKHLLRLCKQTFWLLHQSHKINRAIYTRKNKTRTVPFIRACLTLIRRVLF